MIEIAGQEEWRRCDSCDAKNVPLCHVGEELWSESATACVCLSCLRKAVKLLEDAEKGRPMPSDKCQHCRIFDDEFSLTDHGSVVVCDCGARFEVCYDEDELVLYESFSRRGCFVLRQCEET